MANFNLNKVILGGRLTSDVELKQTPNGTPVVTFSIAVNRRFQSKENAQQQTDFFNVTAWRATAEFVSRYFRKGSSICVIGSLQNRTWTDQQGAKHYATDVIADEVQFVDSKSEDTPSTQIASPSEFKTSPYVPQVYTDPDLPF
jgi:single-strand DNA-binding protein